MTGAFWGFYWIPVRALATMGLSSAWGTVAITAAAVVLMLPLVVHRARTILGTSRVALFSIALGGAAFALYSIAFVYGRVAMVILLYFLTPVWSALIGRYVMGWRISRLRVLAIGMGLAGLTVMLSADGTAPVPKSLGEWMALIAGFLWSLSTTGIRSKSQLGPTEAAFVFAFGAALVSFCLASVLAPFPDEQVMESLVRLLGVAFTTGGIWWALSTGALMWATVRLEPARMGILLMSEVLVGAVSAAVLAGEQLRGLEILGGSLVLLAGVLEVWPDRKMASKTI